MNKASEAGKILGSIKSEKKAKAARENGKLGGLKKSKGVSHETKQNVSPDVKEAKGSSGKSQAFSGPVQRRSSAS